LENNICCCSGIIICSIYTHSNAILKWLHREDEELSPKEYSNRLLYFFNHNFDKLNVKYEKSLRWSLTHRKTIVFGAIAIFIASFFLMGMLGSQFFPDSDRSEFNIIVNASPVVHLSKQV